MKVDTGSCILKLENFIMKQVSPPGVNRWNECTESTRTDRWILELIAPSGVNILKMSLVYLVWIHATHAL